MNRRTWISVLAAAGLGLGAALANVAVPAAEQMPANFSDAGWVDVGGPDEPPENLSTPADAAAAPANSTGPAAVAELPGGAAAMVEAEMISSQPELSSAGSAEVEDTSENAVAVAEEVTFFCVIPGRKYCRYRQPFVEGYPCRCGTTSGRFALPR